MSDEFTVEIISPEQSILKFKTTEVTIPSFEGQIGILKDHIPLITFLRPGLITIKENSKEKSFFIEDGVVEFANNILLILSSTSTDLNLLSQDSIKNKIKLSEEKLSKQDITDKEKYLLHYKINTLEEINK